MRSALLALLFLLPTLAFAQSDISALRNSGNDYIRLCGAAAQGQQSPNAAACGIWLTGVMDGLQAYNSNMKVMPLFDAPNVVVVRHWIGPGCRPLAREHPSEIGPPYPP